MSSRNVMVSKCLGIIAEVVGYCTQKGANHWQTDIKLDAEKATMYVLAIDGAFTEEDVNFLSNQLNISRQKDLEHMYWGLSGFSGGKSEPHLFLAGIMVDNAEIAIVDEGFSITMTRYR